MLFCKFFADIYFCELSKFKCFVGTYFCEFGKNCQKFIPAQISNNNLFREPVSKR